MVSRILSAKLVQVTVVRASLTMPDVDFVDAGNGDASTAYGAAELRVVAAMMSAVQWRCNVLRHL